MDQGVFVASDSRFNLSAGGEIDDGRKVYPLAPTAACVFAGDILSAQRSIRQIRTYLERRPAGSGADVSGPIGRIIRDEYERERARWRSPSGKPAGVHKVGPLFILVGYVTRAGSAGIVRYSSYANFRPIHLLGVEVVGWPADVEAFKTALLRIEAERWQEQRTDVDPKRWCFDVVAAVTDSLRSPSRSRTIGGLVQCVTVTKTGIVEHAISATSDDPMVAENWTTRTVSIEAVRTWPSGRGHQRPAAEVGLVAAHVLD